MADEGDEDRDDDDEAKRCINVTSISNTEVIDDRHIIFYGRGRNIYLNTLPRACRGLARERRFSYNLYGGMLCSSDSVRVLYNNGFGIQEGMSCRLGDFVLTDRDALDAMFERSNKEPQPMPPSTPEPEEVIEEPADDEQQDSAPAEND
jgi:hypothetical protein